MVNIAQERSYNTPLANSSFLPLVLLSLATQKHSPSPTKTQDSILPKYDYIIVGAGSAGSTLASRLTEMPCINVLLIEAGKEAPLLTEIPGYATSFNSLDISWLFYTVPQKHAAKLLKNRQVPLRSGKAIGGSSIVNDMLYVRGNKNDYDDWVKQGAEGWGYKDVLPYFMKMEKNRDIPYLDAGYHGDKGRMSVQYQNYDSEFKTQVLKAAEDFGYDIRDFNGEKQTGFSNLQANMRNGQRCSTAKAYLVPAENRTNLHILPEALVKKVIIKEGAATGVIYENNGTDYEIRATREVILSAGSIKSPQLLMLSGIGHKDELEKHGIPVISDLPVGDNFHDHCIVIMTYELDSKIPTAKEKLSSTSNIQDYLHNRTGPLSSATLVSVCGFVKGLQINPESDSPNLQIYFAEAGGYINGSVQEEIFGPYKNKTIYICFVNTLQPLSKGTIRLNSSNPYDDPLIDPNYLADENDINNIVQGLKICENFLKSEALQAIGAKPLNTSVPGCETYRSEKSDKKYLECLATSLTRSIYHFVGSCKMGNPVDPKTVLDPNLRVKGVRNLRVVDASVMPTITSGNTNIPTIMIAEKAADFIKATISCN